jgi:hypothetical protein
MRASRPAGAQTRHDTYSSEGATFKCREFPHLWANRRPNPAEPHFARTKEHQTRSQAISNTAETRLLLIFAMAYHVPWSLALDNRLRVAGGLGRPTRSVSSVCPSVSQNVHIGLRSDLIYADVNVMRSDDVSLVLMIQAKVQVVVAT